LVTGANGHLGHVLCKTLLEAGYRVRGSVRNLGDAEGCRDLASLGVELCQLELENPEGWAEAVAGCEVVHAVAAPNLLHAKDPERTIVRPMVLGTQHLVAAAAAAGVRRIVATSTCATIGLRAPIERPLDERDRAPEANLPYLRGKQLAEHSLFKACAATGLELVTLHPTAMIGPGFIRPTPSLALFVSANAGFLPPLPELRFHLVDVRDVAIAHLEAMRRPPARGRYILAGELLDRLRLLELLTELAPHCRTFRFAFPEHALPTLCGVDRLVSAVTRRPRQLTLDAVRDLRGLDQRVDPTRAVRELGLRFRAARASIADTLTWLRR